MFHQKFEIFRSGISKVCKRYKLYTCNRYRLEKERGIREGNDKKLVPFYLCWLQIKITFVLFILAHASIQAVVVDLRNQKIFHEGGVQVYKVVERNFSQVQNQQQEYITIVDTRKAIINNLTGNITKKGDSKVSKKILDLLQKSFYGMIKDLLSD